jgi:flagellar protein FlaF
MQNAAQAYSSIAKKTGSPRELEADLLLDAAARLQVVRDAWDKKHKDLEAALINNRRLWSIFVTSVTSNDNPLPAPVRQNIANLGLFVFKQTIAVQIDPKPDNLVSLININRELASGLRASG